MVILSAETTNAFSDIMLTRQRRAAATVGRPVVAVNKPMAKRAVPAGMRSRQVGNSRGRDLSLVLLLGWMRGRVLGSAVELYNTSVITMMCLQYVTIISSVPPMTLCVQV